MLLSLKVVLVIILSGVLAHTLISVSFAIPSEKVLLDQLTNKIGKSFCKVKNEMYSKHAEGFYVRAKPNHCKPDVTIKYISRYLGRPVIATSRIDAYDGDNVTFHYTRHEDNQTITECIPALDFIKRLIVHIPEKTLQNASLLWYLC